MVAYIVVMKKLFSIVVLLLVATLSSVVAQEVGVRSQIVRISADSVRITIDVSVPEGMQVFSLLNHGNEDALTSSLQLGEAWAGKYRLVENGSLAPLNSADKSITGQVLSGNYQLDIYVAAPQAADAEIEGKYEWLGFANGDFPSGAATIDAVLAAGSPVADPAANAAAGTEPAEDADTKAPAKGWALFLITFLVGFGAVFTPCVFPLMPVTVSFFLKKSQNRAEGIRNAWIYTLSIILIYTIPTLIFTLIFGDKFLYQVSTHPVSNLLFFLIFLVFAISFFGAFEISLPSSWANKTDSASRKGGFTGIFFMALTLVIVSFSCTGPIVGGLLAEASGKGIGLGPVIGMLGFGLGLAIPFGVLALFPNMLKSLPKSGGWLNTVKVFFGFIELALAMKFFSNADLMYHWGILTRPVFLAGWIVIFTLLGLYLLGKLKFSHDSDLPYISVPRLFIAMVSFTFALYMLPGMWGAPLKPLSGILPPPSTQDFDLDKLQYISGGTAAPATANGKQAPPPKKYADKFHVPFGLTAYYDMDEAKEAARILNKPIMIDFTGWSCANCRLMENEVWSKPEILQRLRNDFVLVSLYVDDKTKLPVAEQYTNAKGERIKTIGDKNLDYQLRTFNFGAQPLYKFMDHTGNILSEVQYGYIPDVARFAAHLDAMKEKYANAFP